MSLYYGWKMPIYAVVIILLQGHDSIGSVVFPSVIHLAVGFLLNIMLNEF